MIVENVNTWYRLHVDGTLLSQITISTLYWVLNCALGVIISEDFTLKEHHNGILMKAYRILGLLHGTFAMLTVSRPKKAPVLVSSVITTLLLLTSLASTLH